MFNLIKTHKYILILFLVFVVLINTNKCVSGVIGISDSVLNRDRNLFTKSYSNLGLCKRFVPIYNKIPDILGNKTYIILIQNNWELRPSGGFMGSYAVVSFKDNVLNNISVQDIYVPDGQIQGHVDPPKAILQAFPHGFWKLRDANWDVDFQKSMANTAWFFEKGGITDFNGIIALNFLTIKKVLEITGPINLIDYKETLTSDNFYEKAQAEAQVGFFPGSREKFHFLSDATKSLFNSMSNLSLVQKIKLGKLFLDEIKSGQLLFWSNDAKLNEIFLSQNLGGGLNFPDGDFLYITESNLSSNKANCCVTRNVSDEVIFNGEVSHKLKINYKNDSNSSQHNPPENWGGDYKNFLRIVIPKDSEVTKIIVDSKELERLAQEEDRPGKLEEDHFYTLEDKQSYKLLSFWTITEAQKGSEISIEYLVKNNEKNNYKMFIKRQPGIEGFPYKLSVEGRVVFDDEVSKDTTIYN